MVKVDVYTVKMDMVMDMDNIVGAWKYRWIDDYMDVCMYVCINQCRM